MSKGLRCCRVRRGWEGDGNGRRKKKKKKEGECAYAGLLPRTLHIRQAVVYRVDADGVDREVVAVVVGVVLRLQGLAGDGLVKAAAWAVEGFLGGGGGLLAQHRDAVGVVRRELWIGRRLDQQVYDAVDDADGVDADYVLLHQLRCDGRGVEAPAGGCQSQNTLAGGWVVTYYDCDQMLILSRL